MLHKCNSEHLLFQLWLSMTEIWNEQLQRKASQGCPRNYNKITPVAGSSMWVFGSRLRDRDYASQQRQICSLLRRGDGSHTGVRAFLLIMFEAG